MALEVGQLFAGYKVSRVLGAGGMGAIYLASHPRLPRDEALKVLPEELTTDPEFRGRFEREAELAASLSHPHIVGIHDRGEADGQFWISMDYVAGTDAARLLLENYPGGIPVEEALPIITAVGSALDYAHKRGLLHRDVKPANILLTDQGGQGRRVYLADFGIARSMDDAAGLTATNMTVGTVFYCAPEQLRGESIDGRADQYSLACTAFHLLAGTPPYADSNPAVVITKHVGAPVPSISTCRPDLAGLDPVFATAMAKQRSARFANCREFTDQLSQYLNPPPAYDGQLPLPDTHARLGITAPTLPVQPEPTRSPRRRRLLVGVVGVVALLIAAGVFAVDKFTQHHNPPATAAPAGGGQAKAAPNTGPFTGVYRVQFGPGTMVDGTPVPNAPVMTETFAIRSMCGSAGCVATASQLSGGTTTASHPVFDEVDGRWTGVNLGSNECRDNKSTEMWEVFTLQPGGDGGFTGDFTSTAGNSCAAKHTVTFTRTGDVDVATLPDPAALPPRVVSPARFLHGHYHSKRTYHIATAPKQLDYAVTTYCLRSGDRCMSYFYAPDGQVEPLVFGGGNWARDTSVAGKCPETQAPMVAKDTGRFPLPEPPHDPIPMLTGRGTHLRSAPCAVTADYDETLTRTGD
jgi:Protein kinase domain